MSARGRLGVLLGLLLVLAVAFLVWRGSRDDGRAPRAGTSRVDPPAARPERVEGPGRSTEDGREGEEGSEVRISGTVRSADGSPGPVGSLFVAGEVDGRRRMLKARVAKEKGSFTIAVPFEGASSPWPIDVGMRSGGFVARHTVKVVPGGEYRADFVVEEGSVLAGVVADSYGNPVRGLEVIARSMRTPPGGLAAPHLVEPYHLLVGSGEEAVHFAYGTTDEEAGRFELDGLPDGTYGLFSRNEEWYLVHDGLLRPPDRTVRIRAVRAHSVVGTVTDARTGKPIPRATAVLLVRGPDGKGGTKAVSVFDGRLWVVWPPEDREEEFEVEVRVSADGYREGRRTLTLGRGKRRGFVKLGLEPLAAMELGTTVVQVVDATGFLVDLPMSFRLSEVGRDHVRPEAFSAEREGPGVYRLLAPQGRWSLRVWPRSSLGSPMEWRGELSVRSGREDALKCELPPFGTLRIRRRSLPEGSPSWIVSVDSADGSAGMHSQVETQELRVAVEPGDWKVEITSPPGREARIVTVRSGEEVVVGFD